MVDCFYAIDLFVGLSLPVYIHLRRGSRSDGAAIVPLFWLGVAIGLTWELPIFLSALLATDPILGFVRPPPLHPIVFMVAHSFWDGGIFLAGLGVVQALCARPVWTGFRWTELGVFVLWGQGTAFAVEIASVLNEGWVYSDAHAWNPVLFRVSAHPVTLLPQLIWLAAPAAYYFCMLAMARGAHRSTSGKLRAKNDAD